MQTHHGHICATPALPRWGWYAKDHAAPEGDTITLQQGTPSLLVHERAVQVVLVL